MSKRMNLQISLILPTVLSHVIELRCTRPNNTISQPDHAIVDYFCLSFLELCHQSR
jgi:hypothetical protein